MRDAAKDGSGPQARCSPTREEGFVTGGTGRLERAQVPVVVRWRHATGSELDVAQAARDVVELVTGHIQRRLDAPEVLSFASAPITGGGPCETAQAAEPISYVQADERVLGLIGNPFGGAPTHALTDLGSQLKLKPRARRRRDRTLDGVTDTNSTHGDGKGSGDQRRRRPAVVNVRPGVGGARRRVDLPTDPTTGLEKYGPITWWTVPGPGTMLGLLELNPEGNAVAMCRLSGEDKDDTLTDQIDKALALEAGNSDQLVIRYVLLALDMSGTREVRPPRALPAPPGLLERDDIILLDKWLSEGWVLHVIWRDGRRIARDILPAEQILASLRRNRATLWLSSFGRAIDWRSDKLGIRALNLVSAEDRDNINWSLQDGRLRKGPLAGKGWRNAPPRFGFLKEARTFERRPDTEQWPWILRAFELADVGDFEHNGGLSTRKLAAALAAEGCPFDHERIRQILKDPIYATGEWTTNVRGLAVAQEPIPLDDPVPLDRFLRVQQKLALRQGSTKNTPLGEFLFNYVKTTHKQCAGSVHRGMEVGIHGWVNPHRDDLRYLTHAPAVPECCKGMGRRGKNGGWRWERADIQDPVVEKLRELVTHPAVLAEAASAARHQIAQSSARLSADQRTQLERELEEVAMLEDAAADQWLEKSLRESTKGDDQDARRRRVSQYEKVADSLARKRAGLERRLAADNAARAVDAPVARDIENEEDLKRAFLEIMTVDTPADPQMLQLRARLFQAIVSSIEVDDDGGPDTPITVTIEGHLVPDGVHATASPLVAGGELLSAYLAQQRGNAPDLDRRAAVLEQVQEEVGKVAPDSKTAYEYGYHKAVSIIVDHFFDGKEDPVEVQRKTQESSWWTQGTRRRRHERGADPAWRIQLALVRRSGPQVDVERGRRYGKSRAVLAALSQLGEATATEIAAAMGTKKAVIRHNIEVLRSSGHIVHVGEQRSAKGPPAWVYALPSVGVDDSSRAQTRRR